jgi:mono/diheme cytochrome c family protein
MASRGRKAHPGRRAGTGTALLLLAGAPCLAEDGAALYAARCAACHDHPQTGIPPKAQLTSRPTEFIVEKLTFGSMSANALGLSDEQITLIARYLSETDLAPP